MQPILIQAKIGFVFYTFLIDLKLNPHKNTKTD